jgi:hypothetical protein
VEDELAVSVGGLCLGPIWETFAEAVKTTRACYELYANLMNSRLPVISLSTEYSPVMPEDSYSPFPLKTVTIFGEDEQTPQSSISLILSDEGFTWQSIVALRYALLHECLSHAFQAICPTHAGREVLEDSFAAGWMAWLSASILEESTPIVAASRHRRTSDDLLSVLRLIESTTQRQDVHRARLAARRFREIVSQYTASHDEAWQAVLRLSLQINARRWSREMRDALIDSVNCYRSDARTGAGTALQNSLVNIATQSSADALANAFLAVRDES